MNIAIAPFSAAFLPFFVNVAKYLEALGNKVLFLNPDYYEIVELSKFNFSIESYPKNSLLLNKYDEKSAIVLYLSRLYQLKETTKLVRQKNQAYSRAYNYLAQNRNSIDKIVFWNGSGAVEKDICEDLGIKTFFIENGYFPNTLQLNAKGVNCDVEFAKLSFSDFLQFTFKETQHKQLSEFVMHDVSLHTIKRFVYRIFDSQYNYLTYESLMHNVRMGKAKKRFASLPVDELNIDSTKKYIFFPLQVNSDTQIVLNSRYKSMYEVLELILPKLLETGFNVILKEHPAEMEKVDYSGFVDNSKVFIVKKYDIDTLIKHSEFVVCVNSSVGLQALSAARKTLILGKSMYDACPGAVLYEEYKSVLEQVNAVSIDEVSLEKYISHYKEKIFIKGNWRQPTVDFLHRISCRIDTE